QEVATVESDRRAYEAAKAAFNELRRDSADELAADVRTTLRKRLDKLDEDRQALYRRMLVEHAWKRVRVYRATIHDCRPSSCGPSVSARPPEATVLVGIAYAPFLAERRTSLAILGGVASLALLIGYGGVSMI